MEKYNSTSRQLARTWHRTLGAIGAWSSGRPRTDERGLSQSTENAVLLTGAIAIAMAVIFAVRTYVDAQLGNLR